MRENFYSTIFSSSWHLVQLMNRSIHQTVLIVFGVGCALCSSLAAQEASGETPSERQGREIVEEMNRRHESKSEYTRARMTLTKKGGGTRERVIHQWSEESDGTRRSLTKFTSPSDIRNVGTLNWDHPEGQEDDQWLYLPELKRVKRITGGSKKGLFMGTDIAFEDMRPEDTAVKAYRILREEEYGGMRCWVVESRPTDPIEIRDSGYLRTVRWIDQEHYRLLRTEFYGKGDRLVKLATTENWKNILGDLWRPLLTEFSRPATGTSTRMQLTDIELNQGVDPNLLTRQGLQRPIALD
jgi:hypothetical protein